MGASMRQDFLKKLFKKHEFDWDTKIYIKKMLSLLEETKSHHLYEDDKDAKEQLIVDLTKFI
jgi:hypothetical protein